MWIQIIIILFSTIVYSNARLVYDKIHHRVRSYSLDPRFLLLILCMHVISLHKYEYWHFACTTTLSSVVAWYVHVVKGRQHSAHI